MNFADPFPHTVIDDYLDAQAVRAINAEWPDDWEHQENGSLTRKWSTTRLPPTALAVVRAVDVQMVEDAVGIRGLFQDPEMFGAGLHCIPAGGFLKMHCDFNQHPSGWHRRVNMLVYLNQRWDDAWGGHLCLGKNREKRIAPVGGRCVIFETNDRSWHGHPEKLVCPPHMQRRSLAMYFYTAEPPKEAPHSTVYIK